MTVRRASRILVVAAVVALLACVSAMARDTPNRPRGHVYVKTDIWRGVAERAVPLPIAEESGGGDSGMSRASKIQGPISYGTPGRLDSTPMGSAIPSMGGTDFMTPMERTKVQIQRLIRKLN